MSELIVIFDMDGVILDTERLYYEGWMTAAEKMRLPADIMEQAVARCIGVTDEYERQIMETMFQEAGDYDHDMAFRLCREYFFQKIDEGAVPVKEGAEKFLSRLKKDGAVIGLASSSPGWLIKKELTAAGLISCFSAIVAGDEVEKSKPAPEIFIKCAEKLMQSGKTDTGGISGKAAGGKEDQKPYCRQDRFTELCEMADIYVIEDSYNGIMAAKAAGFHPIMIPDRLPPDQQMQENAEEIWDSLTELNRRWDEIIKRNSLTV